MNALQTLYKRNTNESIQQWTIYFDETSFWTVYGRVGGSLVTTEPTYCEGKNVGRSNETSQAEQAKAEAEAKWKKQLKEGYTPNIADVDSAAAALPGDEVMLAHKYPDHRDKKFFQFPVWSDKKFNGMRCKITKSGMWSRKNEPIKACPHVFAAVQHLFDANPDLMLDGELYQHNLGHQLNQIISLCRKQKPTPADFEASKKHIKYYVYDGYNVGSITKDSKFSERKNALRPLLADIPEVVFVESDFARTQAELDNLYKQYVADGYEGQMVRFDVGYENKRTKFLLKRKEFQDDEYEIVGYEEGSGNKAGMMGALVCKLPDGRTFNSNVKGSWEYLTELWQTRESLLGKKATVQYFELTEYGIPQFPYAIAIDPFDK